MVILAPATYGLDDGGRSEHSRPAEGGGLHLRPSGLAGENVDPRRPAISRGDLEGIAHVLEKLDFLLVRFIAARVEGGMTDRDPITSRPAFLVADSANDDRGTPLCEALKGWRISLEEHAYHQTGQLLDPRMDMPDIRGAVEAAALEVALAPASTLEELTLKAKVADYFLGGLEEVEEALAKEEGQGSPTAVDDAWPRGEPATAAVRRGQAGEMRPGLR